MLLPFFADGGIGKRRRSLREDSLSPAKRGWLQRCPRFMHFEGEGQARAAFPTATELASTSIAGRGGASTCLLILNTSLTSASSARQPLLRGLHEPSALLASARCSALPAVLSVESTVWDSRRTFAQHRLTARAELRRDPQKRSSGYGCKVRTMLATAQKAGNLAPGGLGTVTRPPIRVAPSL
jgi:hypothetical protein